MGEYKTTLQRQQDSLLDFAMDSRRVVTEALDYIEVVDHLPMDHESELHLREIKRILLSAQQNL